MLKPGREAKIGETSTDKAGYVLEKVGFDGEAHPRANKHGWVYQHILVAEKKYGFPIDRGFTIHHKNAVRDDNRPENLELRMGNHGKGGDLLHTILRDPEHRMLARVILREYGEE